VPLRVSEEQRQDRLIWVVELIDEGGGADEEDIVSVYCSLRLDHISDAEFETLCAELRPVLSFRDLQRTAIDCAAKFRAAGIDLPARLQRFLGDK
jgi:hypothetical protein